MTVKELAKLLSLCNPEDIVVYDARNSLENGSLTDSNYLTVDTVTWSSGTVNGFVFLEEDFNERH